ncbi:MAG: hypothetical protein DRI54_08310 [Bacteroidetes bacterium]|nr:MAG: hypothetical protein DRI54_08310 [Bacteroidota bacterium]
MLFSSTYSFFDDHSFEITSSFEGMNSRGKWNIDIEKKELLLRNESDVTREEKYLIKKLTDSKMEWEQDIGELGDLRFLLKKDKH